MGYGVYEQLDAGWGVYRWAGYMVPGRCDWADCSVKIDRGLGYKCEQHHLYTWNAVTEEELETDEEGCGLFFCEDHRERIEKHYEIRPKQDTRKWMRHMLSHKSWKQWRAENPNRVVLIKSLLAEQELASNTKGTNA